MFFKRTVPVVCLAVAGALVFSGCASDSAPKNVEVTKSVSTASPTPSSSTVVELKGSEAQKALLKVIDDSKAKAEKVGYTEKTTRSGSVSLAVWSPELNKTAISEPQQPPFFIESFVGGMFEGITDVVKDDKNEFSYSDGKYTVVLKDSGGSGFVVDVKNGLIVKVDAVGGSLPTVVEYKVTEEGAKLLAEAQPADTNMPGPENGIVDGMN